MKILYVCADRGIPLLGAKGASVHVRSLTRAWQIKGHQVTLAIAKMGEGNRPPVLDRVVELGADRPGQSRQLAAVIDQVAPDVVLERYSLQSGAARAVTKSKGLALTLEMNAPLVSEATRHRGLNDADAQAREEETLRSADRIHVVSSELRRYVNTVAPDVPVRWIPNGADVEHFSGAEPAELPGVGNRVVVGFTGSMKPWHGLGDLLEAFAALPNTLRGAAMLVIVGAGPDEPVVRARAARPDLCGQVLLPGYLPHDEIPTFVRRFDIAVAPYVPVPNFYFHPLKVVEYLAAGCAIVFSDQGDIAELVGEAGVGYPAGDTAALTDRLATLIGDADLRRRVGAAAQHRRGHHSWTNVADRVFEFAVG